MSQETMETLNSMTLIGFTEARGTAWHYRADLQSILGGNHYPGAVPVNDVIERLFPWEPRENRVAVEIPADFDTMTHLNDQGEPMRWEVQANRKGITRPDTNAVLGLHKEGYVPHSYREWLIQQVSHLLGDTLQIGSAGLLKNGAVAWVSVEGSENLTTPTGIVYRPFLLAATSLDGSLATTYKRIVTNVVCDNTMSAGLAEDSPTVKIKHSRYSKLKLQDHRSALDIVVATGQAFEAEVAELNAITVTDEKWFKFLDEWAPIPKPKKGEKEVSKRAENAAVKKRDEVSQLWFHDERVAPWKGTGWGVVQAVNTWAHHLQTSRGADKADRNMARAISGEIETIDANTVRLLATVC